MWLFPRERTVRKATAHCKERERKAFLFAPRGSRSVIERTAFGCLTSVAVTEREKEKERKRKGKREREEGRGWEAQTQRQAKKARTRTNSIVQRGVNGLASCLARPDSAHGALVAQIINYGAIFGSPLKKKTRRARAQMSDADAPQAPPAATAAAAPAAATAAAEPESIGGTAAVSADVDHSVTSTASIGEAAAVAGQVLAPPPPPVESAPAPASPATGLTDLYAPKRTY